MNVAKNGLPQEWTETNQQHGQEENNVDKVYYLVVDDAGKLSLFQTSTGAETRGRELDNSQQLQEGQQQQGQVQMSLGANPRNNEEDNESLEISNINSTVEPDLILENEPQLMEASPISDNNICIICNTNRRIDVPNSDVAGLKKFFAKTMSMGDDLEFCLDPVQPFCEPCTKDVSEMKSIAQEIELLNHQFDGIRNKLANKTVDTFLKRKEVELERKGGDEINPNYKGKSRSAVKKRIYNRWKNLYNVNIPGPMLPEGIVDSTGKIVAVRVTDD